jgi:hypothetical protein
VLTPLLFSKSSNFRFLSKETWYILDDFWLGKVNLRNHVVVCKQQKTSCVLVHSPTAPILAVVDPLPILKHYGILDLHQVQW